MAALAKSLIQTTIVDKANHVQTIASVIGALSMSKLSGSGVPVMMG